MTEQNLGLTIKGVAIPGSAIQTALLAMPAPGFSRSEAQGILQKAELPMAVTGDVTRRILQHLKRKGVITYDGKTGAWLKTDLEFEPASTPIPSPEMPPEISTQITRPLEKRPQKSRTPLSATEFVTSHVMKFACVAVVMALVMINAGFAWELAETQAFRASLVAGLMGCDLMRPLLVARGLIDIEARRPMRGALAICLALSLAPLSILSTTSIVSATLFAGVEENDQTSIRGATLDTLRLEYQRLETTANAQRDAWEAECARGGCGPRAAAFEAAYAKADAAARELLAQIVTATETADERSSFIARLVRSFEELGIFGEAGRMLIPLLLALTLELAALFGPGLLLTRTKR